MATLKNTATDTGLRARNSRVNRLYTLLQERMTQKQKPWGEGLTNLDKPSVTQLPLVLRHAKAIERTLLEMPITIEEDDLIVGNNAEDGVIVRPQLPKYATAEERTQANKEGITIEATLAHKTPYYYDVLGKGLSPGHPDKTAFSPGTTHRLCLFSTGRRMGVLSFSIPAFDLPDLDSMGSQYCEGCKK